MVDPAGRDESDDPRAQGEDGATLPPAVLDVGYLERQVLGDTALREELLRLYVGRLQALAPAICAAPGPERREAAHSLKGASLAVGAFALAALCGRLEVEDGPQDGPKDGEVVLMIETTRRRVEELLARK